MSFTKNTKALVHGALLAAILAAGLMFASPAHAAAITVNSAADPGSGGCNGTECTLREAISLANRFPGPDTIEFAIPGNSSKRILVNPEMPTITEAVTIDGYSQPGASPNTAEVGTNAVPLIELDGTPDGSPPGNGLEIVADDVVIRGLVIGGFANNGIQIDDNEGDAPSGIRVEGNFIGTNATGTAANGNRFNGLNLIGSAGGNTIGGTSPASRNLISGNRSNGVSVSSNGKEFEISGNLIGTGKDGAEDLGNSNNGVNLGESDNTVGGTGLGAANTIAFNNGDGVNVVGDDATGNRISGNSIFANSRLGIDLAGGDQDTDGRTANDPGDSDTGANDLQNFPVLASATTIGGKTVVGGTLRSVPRKPFVIEFFSNPANGDEGKTFLGNKAVSTGSDGSAAFTFAPSRTFPVGHTVTATATDVVGANTSEFSGAVVVKFDETPPETKISAGPSGMVRNTSATFAFTSTESGSTFECSLDGAAFGPCASPKKFGGLSQGRHTFRVRATDAAGNTDPTPAIRAWTVDTVKPAIVSLTPKPDALVRTPNVRVQAVVRDGGTDLRKGHIRLFVDGKRVNFSYNRVNDRLAFTARNLAPKRHTVKVVATDAAGNASVRTWRFTVRK